MQKNRTITGPRAKHKKRPFRIFQNFYVLHKFTTFVFAKLNAVNFVANLSPA